MEDALLFNGTSMEVFKSEDPDTILVRYTDTISAFNGIKKATIAGKGEINASIAAMIAGYLSENGIYSCPFLSNDYRGRVGSSFKNYSQSMTAETDFCATCSRNNNFMFTIG